jgi:hypothetical protein
VVDVGVEVIEEDGVQEDAADLGKGRGRDTAHVVDRDRPELGAREPRRCRRRAHADREHAVGPESDRGTERRDLTEPAVAEVHLGTRRADGDRREDDRDRRRRAHECNR